MQEAATVSAAAFRHQNHTILLFLFALSKIFCKVASDVKQADRARKKNCEYYTRTVYGDSRNYDLTLNTEKLGIDKAVQLVLAAAEDL